MQLRDAVRAARTGVAVRLYLFDCLYYEGVDLTNLPLVDRKKVLRDVVWYDDPIHFTPHRTTGSAAMYRDACARGAGGNHRQAGRLPVCRHPLGRLAQDQVRAAAGIRDRRVHRTAGLPRAPRRAAGGLLRGGKLRYAGKVGTGYDAATLRQLHRKLAPLARRTSPFAPGPVAAGEDPLGHPEARRPDRLRRVDHGRAAAPSALPRAPGRQGGQGGAAGGIVPPSGRP